MLWVDKHRPTQLDKLDFHDDLTTQLKRISHPDSVGNMSHLLFYGPSGAGKKTRVMALLREVRFKITSRCRLTELSCLIWIFACLGTKDYVFPLAVNTR